MLQSFDLQRVLEGEKALRSEATRQLKEVEKKLVSLRSPGVALSSPMPAPPGSERNLEADKALLQDQIKAHSAQVGRHWLATVHASLPFTVALGRWQEVQHALQPNAYFTPRSTQLPVAVKLSYKDAWRRAAKLVSHGSPSGLKQTRLSLFTSCHLIFAVLAQQLMSA